MLFKIKHRLYCWLEERAYIKAKCCCACGYFVWFHGSAGVCTADKDCPCARLKDFSDTCDCGKFRKKGRNNG